MFSSPLHLPTSFLRSFPHSPLSVTNRGRRWRGVRCAAAEERAGTAVLWFKQDLRVDDHPGLVEAAAKHRSVVPVYVFDRRILRGYSDVMLELLISALEALRNSLKDQGCDLLIGFGNTEIILQNVVNEVKATRIFVEDEVEFNLCTVVNAVKTSILAMPFSWGNPEFVSWQSPLYNIEDFTELPESYNEFQKMQPLSSPFACPKIPVLERELEEGMDYGYGALPTYGELKIYLHRHSCQSDEFWISNKAKSAKDVLRENYSSQPKMSKTMVGFDDYSGISTEYPSPSGELKKSFFLSRKSKVVGGGTDVALGALAAYLRYLEGTSRDDWQELHEKLRISESRTGASFDALFRHVLCLGVLSRRRVHYETIKYEKERNAGFLSPFGYSVMTVAAAVDAVKSMEWYWLLNLKSQSSHKGRFPVRVWRWNGYVIQYTAVGLEGPAVLLVHGFGAFLEHFRDNVSSLADDGNRVWAITLLGFGKSEKPNIMYTELVWVELLRDFIADVIGEPVHLVGNSIGGYLTATVSGLWPSLVKSLILINAAGSIIPDFSSIQATNETQISGIAWLGARLLLVFLRLQLQSILKNYYPMNPDRADTTLTNEMLRASYDPGVLIIMESVFGFTLPLPLNYLIDSFEGKVLVIQGIKDPLSKPESRLSMFKKYCRGIAIQELDAGHCPHDEMPEMVNSILKQWLLTAESSLLPARTM